MVMHLGTALSFVEQRRQTLASDADCRPLIPAPDTPGAGQQATMIGQEHHDSIVQRGIDEAFACRDMLAPAPAKPSLVARLGERIGAGLRVMTQRKPTNEQRDISAALRGSRQIPPPGPQPPVRSPGT
jgi:hypothetical protein